MSVGCEAPTWGKLHFCCKSKQTQKFALLAAGFSVRKITTSLVIGHTVFPFWNFRLRRIARVFASSLISGSVGVEKRNSVHEQQIEEENRPPVFLTFD